MELRKIKDLQTEGPFKAQTATENIETDLPNLDTMDFEMTKEMKYIKWPSKKKVFAEALSVIAGTAIFTVIIAAGDEVGALLVNAVLKLF